MSTELVRYRPGQAVRWLQTGADTIRKGASARGKSIVGQTGSDQRPLTENVRVAAGAIFDFGRSAYADMLHSQAQAQEFILLDDRVDIVRGSNVKTIPYALIKAIELKGDKATLTLERGFVHIRPFAHILSGRLKVPVGWSRNGIEVPYELLIDELAARCGLDIHED